MQHFLNFLNGLDKFVGTATENGGIETELPFVFSQAVRMTSAAARDNAVCLDGSVPVFYFRPGSGSGANKWHIFHEGGGWCTGPESCAMRARSNLGTSDILSDRSENGLKIYSFPISNRVDSPRQTADHNRKRPENDN